MARHARALALLLLLPALAYAQPTVTRGGALKKRQYQTYSNMMLYVDGALGSDASACTSSGAGACATIQGAIDKVPDRIFHAVTINVAAGTYAGSVYFTNRYFGMNSASSYGSVTIQGPTSWTTATLGAGSATGTLTASNTAPAASTGTLGTLTDSGQSWAVDALKGKFVTMTSGAGAGTTRVIVGNTATTLSLNATLTGSAGNTYAIQEPAATVDLGTVTFGIEGLVGTAAAAGALTLSDLKFVGSSSSGLISVRNSKLVAAPTVVFRRTSAVYNGSSVVLRLQDGWAAVSTNSAYFESVSSINPMLSLLGDSRLQDVAGYWRCGAAMAQGVAWLSGSVTYGTSTNIPVLEVSAAATQPVVSGGMSVPLNLTVFSLLLRGTATVNALDLGVVGTNVFPSTGIVSGTLRVETAATALRLHGGSALRFAPGGSGGSLAVSGTTTEIDVDGQTMTYAAFLALNPRVVQGPYKSMVWYR